MALDLQVKIGKQRVQLTCDARTVVLCDDAESARRTAKAVAEAGGTLLTGDDAPRGSVRDQLPRKFDSAQAITICERLHLSEDALDWRPRESDPIHRLLGATIVALASGDPVLVFDVTTCTSPFDVAHLCAHMRRTEQEFGVTVIAVIWDPALISSAGTHLVIVHGDAVVEQGPAIALLAHPRSESLQQRLASTPIPSPLAMQMRQVQRIATEPVNYSHTTIIQLPTRDTIALAGGDE